MELFQSFFMGGYECADHINRNGDRVNLLRTTAHDVRADDDYMLLAQTGIKTVREGICWSQVEIKPFEYDFSEVANRIQQAANAGIQQIWDICHFGFPDDLMPAHPKFTQRFVSLCIAFAAFYRKHCDEILVVIPINEISFLSWHAGDVRGTVPFAVNSGFDIKYHLCKAAIQGIKALLKTDPFCRIMLSEPLIKVHSLNGLDHTDEIWQANESQYQAMDIIAGRMCPELGGEEHYLDILGFNYYHNCQWDSNNRTLAWPAEAANRTPLYILLQSAYNRYRKPIVLTETGHFGTGRAAWLKEVFEQCMQSIHTGVDLKGICLYPLIDRPDWDDLENYHNSGLWDIDPATKVRTICEPYATALGECMHYYDLRLQLPV